MFLAKMKPERELKQNLIVTKLTSVKNVRDLSSSAQDGELANLGGDLLLAHEYKNLGDKPMV